MAEDDQRQTIIKLLTTAEKLANDMQDSTLAYVIERAIDGFGLRDQTTTPLMVLPIWSLNELIGA